jgi:hypothetical protein
MWSNDFARHPHSAIEPGHGRPRSLRGSFTGGIVDAARRAIGDAEQRADRVIAQEPDGLPLWPGQVSMT